MAAPSDSLRNLGADAKNVDPRVVRGIREASRKDRDAGTFEVEYRDGFRAFVVIPNGWIHEGDGGGFVFACQQKGQEKPDGCHYYLQQPDPFAHGSS